MSLFNQYLLEIHEQISIRDEDRQPFTHMFDTISNWLMKNMCAINPLFKSMYKGTQLFGSYANQVRIIEPSEFDVSILLKLPYELAIFTSSAYPGFARISRKECYGNDFDEEVFSTNRLNRLKINEWIKSIMNRVLTEVAPPPGFSIQYSPRNVAHNIYVRNSCKTISIDFVPSIVIDEDDISPFVSMSERDIQEGYMETFLAVPQSITGIRNCYNRRMNMFRIVNPEAERHMLWDKQNLKVVYRLLKSIRDNYDLKRLKSYFLTAAFLIEVEKQPKSFWYDQVEYIYFHMLNALIEYFDNNFLPFYWDDEYNLLKILKYKQRVRYHNTLLEVYIDLKKKWKSGYVSYAQLEQHFETRDDDV